MLTILSLAVAIQTAATPPALPEDPGPQRRKAAAALFDADPNASENSWGLQIAASMFAGEILRERNLNSLDRDARLSTRFKDRVKSSPMALINEAIQCVAEPLAERLSVPELIALHRFAASPDGRTFWVHYLQTQPWEACYAQPVRRQLEAHIEEDLASVVAETPSP